MRTAIERNQVAEKGMVDDWDTIPVEVKQAALKADKVKPGGRPEQSWMAMPARHVQATIEAGQLPADRIVETWVAVPKADVQAAIQAGQIPQEWIVRNYGHIANGWGIPFMMVGLILLCACVVVYVVTSLLTPAPTDEELAAIGWEPPLKAIFGKRITGITDPRMIAIGLGVLMTVLYIIFR
jgi:hypothetical protein